VEAGVLRTSLAQRRPQEGSVLDLEGQNIPEVVVFRRGAGGVLGNRGGWVNWVKGSKWGQFTSNLRGRRTIPVTSGGSQVSGREHKGGSKGELAEGTRGARGNAPCTYVNVMCVPE
jgi:hypothetical protein